MSVTEYTPYHLTGNGSNTVHVPGWSFISTDHVEVYVAGVLQVLGTDYTWDAGFAIVTTTPAAPNGDEVRIIRVTPDNDIIVDYSDGARVTDQNLDMANRQNLFSTNEKYSEQLGARVLLAEVRQTLTGINRFRLIYENWTAEYDRVRLEFIDVKSALLGNTLTVKPVDNGTPITANLDGYYQIAGNAPVFTTIWEAGAGPDSSVNDGYFGYIDFFYNRASQISGTGVITFRVFNLDLPIRVLWTNNAAVTRADGFHVEMVSANIYGTMKLWGYPN